MRGGLLAVALVLWACGPASAQALMLDCGDPVGDWTWLLGGTVRFDPDGSATWSPAQGSSSVFEGSWHCDGRDGSIVVAWQHGFADRLRLAADGQTLSGANQADVAVEGRRPEQPQEAGSAPDDPTLVGTWLLEMRLPSAQGPIAVWWTINADGSYVVDAGPFTHAGSMTAGASSFDLRATTSDYRDSGRYEIGDWATIVTYGQHGIGRWHRREPALRLEVASVNAQLVPVDVPAITDAARALARNWQPDALLSMIDYERPDSPNPQPPSVRLSFFSPSTGLGMWVTVDTEGTRFFGASRGGIAIPNGFLDLPQAFAVARQYGVQPPLERAMLRVWTPQGSEPVLAWTVSGSGGGINIDAVEGDWGAYDRIQSGTPTGDDCYRYGC
jgi:hypothetical protein